MANTTWSTTDKTANVTLSGTNNLTATASGAGAWVRTIDNIASGKFYWEVLMSAWVNGNTGIGITNASSTPNVWNATNLVAVFNNATVYRSGTQIATGLTGTTSGATMGFALDATNGLLWIRVAPAGNWNGSGTANPATGVGGLAVGTVAGGPIGFLPVTEFSAASDACTANFGDTAFSGTVPSGFTSGFTSGLGPATSNIVTQSSIEEWGAPSDANVTAVVTQSSIEEWGIIDPALNYARVTQSSIEEWVPVEGVQFRSSTLGPTTNSTTNVIALPGGVLGDLIIVGYTQTVAIGTVPGPVVTPPAGWTTLFNVNGQGAIYRLVQAGDPTSITLTSTISNTWASCALRYFNVDQTNPIDVSNNCIASQAASGTFAGYYNAPSVAPKYPNDKLVGIWMISTTFPGVPTLPTGFVQRAFTNGQGIIAADRTLVGTGLTGNQFATWSGTGGVLYTGVQIAIKYAPDTVATPQSTPATWGAAYGTTGSVASTTIPLSRLGARTGDLVCTFAIPVAGTTITTPAGYTRSALINGAYLFTKIYAAGDADPVYTNSGTVNTTTSTVCIRAVNTSGVTLDQVLTAAGTGSSPFTATLLPATPASPSNYVLVTYQSSTSGGTIVTPTTLVGQGSSNTGNMIWLGDVQPGSVPTPSYVATYNAGVVGAFSGIEVIVSVPSGYTDIRARVGAGSKARGTATLTSAYTDILARVQAGTQSRPRAISISATQDQVTQVGVEHWAAGLPIASVTQVSVEHFLISGVRPAEALTQVSLEHWATVTSIPTRETVTQVSVEHWVSLAAPVSSDGWLWVCT